MDRGLRVAISAKMFTDRKCFGPGVAQLLALVDELHSLRAAAMSMSMAYSKAWTVIRSAEEGLGFKLLTSTAGRETRRRRGADRRGAADARRLR